MSNYDNDCATCKECECSEDDPTTPCPDCPDPCAKCDEICPAIPDGTFTNATIVVTRGCIQSIASGSNVVQQRPEPCITPESSTAAPSYTAAVGTCNLTKITGTEIDTKLYFAAASLPTTGDYYDVQFSNCGSQAQPLSARIRIPATPVVPTLQSVNGVYVTSTLINPVVGVSNLVADTKDIKLSVDSSGIMKGETVGLDYDSGGVIIEHGLVKAYNPTSSATTYTAGEHINIVSNEISVDLPSIFAVRSQTIFGIGGNSSFVDPATGTLPVSASWGSVSISLYGNRIYFDSPYASTTYYSSIGIAVTTLSGTGYWQLPTDALAEAAFTQIYTFAGV